MAYGSQDLLPMGTRELSMFQRGKQEQGDRPNDSGKLFSVNMVAMALTGGAESCILALL